MGKKYIIAMYIICMTLGALAFLDSSKTAANETVVIPKEAIRLRILANSDEEADQQLKRNVRDKVNAQISTWVKDLTSFSEAKKVIKNHLPDIEKTVADELKKEGSKQTFHIQFGQVSFPTKLYGQYVYPAGEYEAVLITLGEGKGANWWCVLFPPLCFLDFSTGQAVPREKSTHSPLVADNTQQIKVHSFIVDKIREIYQK